MRLLIDSWFEIIWRRKIFKIRIIRMGYSYIKKIQYIHSDTYKSGVWRRNNSSISVAYFLSEVPSYNLIWGRRVL